MNMGGTGFGDGMGIRLAATQFTICARRADSTAACWGANNSGMIADGTRTTRYEPTAVTGLTDVVDVAVGRFGGDPRVRALDAAIASRGLPLVLLLRLSPLFPFNFLNYALALTGLSGRSYAVGTAVGMLPFTAASVYVGALAGGGDAPRPVQWALAAVGVLDAVMARSVPMPALYENCRVRPKIIASMPYAWPVPPLVKAGRPAASRSSNAARESGLTTKFEPHLLQPSIFTSASKGSGCSMATMSEVVCSGVRRGLP
jgi:hypothetical protein